MLAKRAEAFIRQAFKHRNLALALAFLGWMTRLPEDLENELWHDIEKIEGKRKVKYVTAGALPRVLSFKVAMQPLRAFEEILRHAPARRIGMITAILLGAIVDARLPTRPDRVEPGAVKRRPTKASLLTRHRKTLKTQIMRDKQRQMAACLS